MAERNKQDSGLYLYGIIRESRKRGRTLTGIRAVPAIYTVCHGGLSAIVSDALAETREAARENLLAHNSVLEQIMKAYSVLPLRLGTVARSEAEVRAFLEKAYRPLHDALEAIEGKVEFDVEAEWNGEEIFRLIDEQDERVRKYKEEIAAADQPAGLDERITAGMMVAQALAQRQKRFAEAIEAELKPWSERVTPLTACTKQTVFVAAFLVPKQRMNDFEEAIHRLGDRHGRFLKFRYTGPLPCYSFVSLRAVTVDFQAVDEARRELGLDDRASLLQIKGAFRKFAAQCHPDRNPHDPEARERFEKLAASYQILLALWETVGGESSQPIPLTREHIGGTLFLVCNQRRWDPLSL